MTDALSKAAQATDANAPLFLALGRIEGKQDQINETVLTVMEDLKTVRREVRANKEETDKAVNANRFRLNLFTGIGVGVVSVISWLGGVKDLVT